MRKHFKVDAPGADLLYSKPYNILMEQVVSGRVIGRETIQGVPANHLAFQGEEVDFQLWIQEGNQPLPLRFVITTKNVKANPQFTVQLSNWNTQPKLSGPRVRVPRARRRQARHIGRVVVLYCADRKGDHMRSKWKRVLMMFGVVGVLLVAAQEVLAVVGRPAHAGQRRGRRPALGSQKHVPVGLGPRASGSGFGPRVT